MEKIMGTHPTSGGEFIPLDTFECTICFDTPASPIHSCQNGHIVCGICQMKLSECPTCKFNLAVCPFLQRISKQFDFKSECKFAGSGCKELINSADMMKHFEMCCYRDILCEETATETCTHNTRIIMKEFQNHLELLHKCKKFSGFTEKLSVTVEKSGSNRYWPIEIIDENILLHKQCLDGQIYFWLSFLGNKEDADKRRCRIAIEHKDEQCGMIKHIWWLPILAYHAISNLQNERFKYCAIIPNETLYVMGETGKHSETEDNGIESSAVYLSVSIKNNN